MRKAIWYTRYWLGRQLITLGLWVFPRCRYRTELRQAIYKLRDQVILEVATHRALKEAKER